MKRTEKDNKNKITETGDRMAACRERVRGLREDHDLTQTQVAELLHVGQRTYADYELGNIRIPVDSLIRLAEYYDTDMDYICGVSRTRHRFPEN